MSAQPGEGTDVPPTSTSTRPRASSPTWSGASTRPCTPASEKAIEKQHAKGRKTARERIEMLFDEGILRRARRAGAAPLDGLRPGEEPARTATASSPATARSTAARSACSRQDFTVFGGSLGEVYGEKITKVMDLADQDRLPDHRHQRGRRRPHPGGRRLARPLRRDLPPQRARLGRHPADQPDHGQLRRRPRLLPRRHRLHDHGRPDLRDVHHRTRRHQDRHRRGRHDGGPRRRAHPQHQVGQRPLHGLRRGGRHRLRQGAAVLPPAEQPRRAADVRRGPPTWRSPTSTGRSTRSSPTRRTSPTTCTTSSRRSLDDEEFLEVQALFAPNIIVGYGRVEGRSGRHRRQPADAVRRLPRHRRLREGRPLRAHLRRLQHPGPDLRRRARLPARHRPGVAAASSAAAPS